MDEVTPITLDDTLDGKLMSQQPGQYPGQVTFISVPNSCARFTAGADSIEVQFLGGRFIHNHPLVVKALTRMTKSGTGINILPATVEQIAEVKQNDMLAAVAKETATETAVAAVAAAAARK